MKVRISLMSKIVLDKKAKKLVRKVFWRTMFLMFCTSYTKQQGTTYGWTMIPFLEDIYGKETPEFYEAMSRHQDFFNTAPGMSPFIFALTISMEEERKLVLDAGKEFDSSSIEAVKASLMGPFAGIGDSIFTGVLRIIATGVALGFCQQGSIIGPILFLLVYNIPNVLIRWFGGVYGYKLGSTFVADAMKSGTLSAFTKGFQVLGLIMVGAMSAQFVNFKTSYVADFAGTKFVLQNVFDQILPGLLPLSVTMICFAYLRKKNKPVTALVAIFLAAVVFTVLGITK
jgi:mannose/fructose/N-acetylgalactosamine-specific phosphotransferase system component IID